jgi:GNAT superfamily N-acetyltransferase
LRRYVVTAFKNIEANILRGIKILEFKAVRRTNSGEFDQALQIYSSSFPPVETKPVSKVKKMLLKDKNYHLFVMVKDGSVVGISLLYVFKRLRSGLLDYMTIIPEFRGQGMGTELFRRTLNRFKRMCPNSIGLFLEVQKEDVEDLIERRIRKNRIRFYRGLGAKKVGNVDYLPPPQHGTNPEEMHLMIVLTVKVKSLSREYILDLIKTTYVKVYGYRKDDLLKKFSMTKMSDLPLD